MNGKFILIVIICMNLLAFFISMGYAQTGTNNTIGDFYLVSTFLDSGSYDQTVANATQTKGVELSENYSTALQSLTEEQSGSSIATNILEGLTSFLDVIKMVLAGISLLTPIPLIAFLSSLLMPLWVTIAIGLPLSILYLVALMEFVRGGEF